MREGPPVRLDPLRYQVVVGIMSGVIGVSIADFKKFNQRIGTVNKMMGHPVGRETDAHAGRHRELALIGNQSRLSG